MFPVRMCTARASIDFWQPYGRIEDIEAPKVAGKFPATAVEYRRYRSATIARNVLNGYEVTLPRAQLTRPAPLHYDPRVRRYWRKCHGPAVW